ncbi:MAG: hypothetical protein WBD36_01875 [Bacteroidota bacterium]
MRLYAYLMLVTGLTASPAVGQSSLGGIAGSPMRMGFGARGIGLGNAMTAVITGDVSSYYNPALVPFQATPVGLASYGFLSLDRRLNFVSYTQSLKPAAGISVGILNAGVSNIDGRNRDGVHTEDYSTSENAFFLSFGLKPDESVAIGVTTKILYYSLYENIHSTTVGVDLGGIYVLSEDWTIGAAIQDIGSKYKWDTSKLYGRLGNATEDRFPLRKRIGVSYAPIGSGVLGTVEFEAIGSSTFFRVGAELRFIEGFQLRGGIDEISPSREVSPRPSVGFTFQTQGTTWSPAIHYSYVDEPYAPSPLHILAITLRFE